MVCGGTQAGKTTLLNALAGSVPRNERVITIEEVFELTPQLPDVVQMQTRSANLQGEGEIPLRRLIKESLRMRPSRIIVGEVRQEEALDLLVAMNAAALKANLGEVPRGKTIIIDIDNCDVRFTKTGYDEFYAGAVFDENGKILKAYIDSHVAYSSDNCKEIDKMLED